MSWRFIIIVLAIAAGISAWLGLRLGDWLVAHGPLIEVPVVAEPDTVPVLDADGRPYLAQPPQPLVNGRLAVPDTHEPVTWEVEPEALDYTLSNPHIATATTSISMYQAQQIANQGGESLAGIADIGDLLGGGANAPLQPIEPAGTGNVPVSGLVPATPPANAGAWQNDLRQALAGCQAESFFDRPSCLWAARNKYCGANNAWGMIEDCPARNF